MKLVTPSTIKLSIIGTTMMIAGCIGYDKGVEMFEKTFPKFIDKFSLVRAAVTMPTRPEEDEDY